MTLDRRRLLDATRQTTGSSGNWGLPTTHCEALGLAPKLGPFRSRVHSVRPGSHTPRGPASLAPLRGCPRPASIADHQNGPHPTRAIEGLAGAAASALCVTLALGDERRRCRQRPRWITSTLARDALGKRPNIRDLPAASLCCHRQLSAARCSQTHGWASAATPAQRRTTRAQTEPEGPAMCLR